MTEARSDRAARRQLQAASAAVLLSITLVVLKLGAWAVTGSVAILSTLLDSFVDVAATVVTAYSVHHALRPPDRSHRYGHGKAEALGALAQGAFIAGSALFIAIQAIDRLIEPRPLATPEVGIVVVTISLVLTLLVVVVQRRVVRSTGSQAIHAISINFIGDVLTNLAVIVTLTIYTWTRVHWIDPAVAIGIAAFLLYNVVRIARRALDTLMDRELPAHDRTRIHDIVCGDPRVRGMHNLRTRSAGATHFIELHLELDGNLTLDAAHDIADDVEQAIIAAFPGAAVLVHQEPAGLDDDRLDHRVGVSSPS